MEGEAKVTLFIWGLAACAGRCVISKKEKRVNERSTERLICVVGAAVTALLKRIVG